MSTGREIYDELEEYKLKPAAGVKDYIFYFVPDKDDGFGSASHKFFNTHYTNHVRKDVSSIEQMIGVLFADVSAGLKRIREIVIVAHATPQGMMQPVLTGASDTNLPEYRHTTEKTLSFLQKDFADGKFAGFKKQRAAVVQHLFDDSWVTIRACRVGSSQVCMYAYYAFFGGRANVYAPKEYMFFGQQTLLPGSRIENREQLHRHLVMQHFVKNGDRTPDRQQAIVKEILDPALFSSPATLASKLSTSSTDEAADYDALVTDLQKHKMSDNVIGVFAAAGQSLSKDAQFLPNNQGHLRTIVSSVTTPGGTFKVDYGIDQNSVPDGIALTSQARVINTKGSESVPFQLFLRQYDDDQFTGKMMDGGMPFRLASYEDSGTDPSDKQRFDAVVKLLNGNRYSDGTIDLKAMFKDALDVDLPDTPNITSLTPNLSGPKAKLIWSIGGNPPYTVKQEIAVASDATQAHTLTVYRDPRSLALNQEIVKSTAGLDPDTPGTELPNYLDQYSLDELADFIDYLRNPYRAANSYYIRHAQNAINRKRGSVAWEQARLGPDFTNIPLQKRPYTSLGLMEMDDIKQVAYDFDFNDIWQEVKQSFPVPPIFQNDLFEEDDLWARLHGSDPLTGRNEIDDIDPASPSQDLEALRQLESQGLDPFYAESKEVYERRDSDKISCDQFRAVVQKWKELQGQPAEAIRDQLREIIGPDGKSFYDYLWTAFEWYDRINAPLEFLEITKLSEHIKSVPSLIVEHVAFLEESAVAQGLAEILSPALTGLLMWIDFAHEQVEAGEVWKRKGSLVAVRQWLLGLELMADHGPVPDEPTIDLGDDFQSAYEDELGVHIPNSAKAFIPFPEEFKEGFEEGKEMVERVGKTIVKRADETSAKAFDRLNLAPCQVQTLLDAGVLDREAIRSQTVSAIVRLLLEKLPHA